MSDVELEIRELGERFDLSDMDVDVYACLACGKRNMDFITEDDLPAIRAYFNAIKEQPDER